MTSQKLTQEIIKERLKEVYGDKIELIDEYVNAKTKIRFFCHEKDENGKEHGEFIAAPYQVINLKRGCRICSGYVNQKPKNFWNVKENCFEEASKYKGKYDFQLHAEGAYNSALRNGWLEEINSKFYDGVVHYMKEDDNINCVYVYEFERYNTCYVGRTNCLKRRHRQHLKEGDSVLSFAVSNGVSVPTPKVLEEGLTPKDSQEKEDYWLKEYKENGWEALNKGVTGLGRGSLGASLKWDYEHCKEEASKYSKKYEMKLKCQSAYSSSVKNGWIDEFFPIEMKKRDNFWNVKENVLEAAKQCVGARDMVKKFGGAYNSAKKNGWLDMLKFGKS